MKNSGKAVKVATSQSFEKASSHARVISIKFTKGNTQRYAQSPQMSIHGGAGPAPWYSEILTIISALVMIVIAEKHHAQ